MFACFLANVGSRSKSKSVPMGSGICDRGWAPLLAKEARNGAVPRQNLVYPQNECLGDGFDAAFDKILAMILAIVTSFRHLLGWAVSAFRSREDLILENLALRQQLLTLHAKRPRRRLTTLHKLFWVVLRRLWSEWERSLILVTPRTVVSWHRAGFRLYWTWVSRARRVGGRRRVSKEVRTLIFRMAAENPTWGAPRIHGELLKLGFCLSETTVSRWLRRIPRNPDPAKRWLTFLRNHREAIAAMDFFTVPTLTFGVLYCFFVIGHDRRKILRFNVTRNPNALWIVQQMREAWPYAPMQRFLLLDHDSKFGRDVISAAKDMGSQPVRTAFRRPWQNGVAERWAGSCRRDLLDHVIVLNERHLKRLMTEYVRYYHEDRTHLGLAKDTPTGRPTAICPAMGSKIRSFTRLGGLHHRYAVAA
jgi:putative transposase